MVIVRQLSLPKDPRTSTRIAPQLDGPHVARRSEYASQLYQEEFRLRTAKNIHYRYTLQSNLPIFL